MSGVIVMIAGFAIFFNIAVVKLKFEHGRTSDAMMDLTMLIILGWLFSGSEGGLVMGTIASALFSIFLYFSPPDFSWMDDEDEKA